MNQSKGGRSLLEPFVRSPWRAQHRTNDTSCRQPSCMYVMLAMNDESHIQALTGVCWCAASCHGGPRSGLTAPEAAVVGLRGIAAGGQ
jgi:hypothetical protein